MQTSRRDFAPDETVGQMATADELEIHLIAGAPLVRQPVAIAFDDRGRLWVIQYLRIPIRMRSHLLSGWFTRLA